MTSPSTPPELEELAAELRESSPQDVERALDFAASAGAYAHVTGETQQYVRDVDVFRLLDQKFSRSGMFADREAANTWLRERMAVNADNVDQLLRRLQGDGAGEVDALNQINGSLRGLLTETRFATTAAGEITSNVAGIDLERVNRFTGEVVERIQVKSNWSTNPDTLKKTLDKFVAGADYDESVTLAGPRELIELAKERGLPNRLVIVGDANGNRVSGERLAQMVEDKKAAVDGALTFEGVAERVGQGAIVGAGVAVTVSSVRSYLAYRRGEITAVEAFRKVGRDGSKGALVGGSLAGLSVVFPPGLIGVGIGVVVGMQLRRVVDIAYGEGAYKDLLDSMGSVTASVDVTARGLVTVSETASHARRSQADAVENLVGFATTARDTNAMLAELRSRRASSLR